MDPFRLQRRLLKQIISQKPSVKAGMELLRRELTSAPQGHRWKKLSEVDWSRGEHDWIKWFNALLTAHPLQNAELLWFETPSELNYPLTSVSAYAKLGLKSETYGLDEPPIWPPNHKGFTNPLAQHKIPQLQEAFDLAGFKRDPDPVTPGVYAASSAYIALLVLNGLPKTNALAQAGRNIAVLTGWASGDVEPIGQLSASGWGPIPRVRAPSDAKPEELDPNSDSFRLTKYIKQRDVKDRLQRDSSAIWDFVRFREPGVFRQLLKAGAHPNARDAEGRTALHIVGATDLRTLHVLVDAGADPKVLDEKGHSVLDHVVWDGRCTLRHVKFFADRGVQLKNPISPGSSPLHVAAMRDFGLKALGPLMDYWLAHGFKLSQRNAKGNTPLWIALAKMASDSSQGEDSDHHRVAIMLLDRGANPNERYRGPKHPSIPQSATPLMLNCYWSVPLFRSLLKHGANPLLRSAEGKTALDYALLATRKRSTREGAKAIMKLLQRAMNRQS